MLASLDRYLKECGPSFSIRADQEFKQSHKVLNGCAKKMRGKGKKPMKAEALTEEKELVRERNWRWRSENAEQDYLLHTWTAFWNERSTRAPWHFVLALEICEESHIMSNRVCYWTEGITKTWQGEQKAPEGMVAQKAFAVGGPKRPVAMLAKA